MLLTLGILEFAIGLLVGGALLLLLLVRSKPIIFQSDFRSQCTINIFL